MASPIVESVNLGRSGQSALCDTRSIKRSALRLADRLLCAPRPRRLAEGLPLKNFAPISQRGAALRHAADSDGSVEFV